MTQTTNTLEQTSAKAPGFWSRYTLWVVLGTVALVALLAGLFAMRIPGGFVDPSTLPQKVTLKTLSAEPVEVVYKTQGTLEAANRIDMNVETAGVVESIRFDEGVPVAKGQVLVTLRANKQQAQQTEALAGIGAAEDLVLARQADITRAEAEFRSAQSAYRLALGEYKRYAQLYQEQLISALELEQKRNATVSARSTALSAQKRLGQAQAEVDQAISQKEQAEARLGYNRALSSETVLKAPFAGTIGEKYVDVGDYVVPGEKILTLADNRSLKVAFSVPESYGVYLTDGSPVSVAIAGLDERLSGYVVFVDPVVDLQNRTIRVKALLATPSGLTLRDGQFGQVRLTLESKPEGLKVPEEAIVPQGEKFFVYVAKRDEKGVLRARLQQVYLGERDTGWAEVTRGLAEGAQIAVSGLKKLFDGAIIAEPDKSQPSSSQTQGR